MLIFLVILEFRGLVNGQFDYTENGDSAEYSKFMNGATKIRNELFTTRNYDKYLAPVFEPLRDSTDERGNLLEESFSGSKVPKLHINFMLYYLKLFNLDAESQIFSATVEFKMDWRDPRLAWKQEKFGGLDSIYIGTDILWIPDARVGNAKILDPINGLTIPIARVSSNGTVFLTTIFYTETACGINANKFPFDRQNCSLPIISLGLDS